MLFSHRVAPNTATSLYSSEKMIYQFAGSMEGSGESGYQKSISFIGIEERSGAGKVVIYFLLPSRSQTSRSKRHGVILASTSQRSTNLIPVQPCLGKYSSTLPSLDGSNLLYQFGIDCEVRVLVRLAVRFLAFWFVSLVSALRFLFLDR